MELWRLHLVLLLLRLMGLDRRRHDYMRFLSRLLRRSDYMTMSLYRRWLMLLLLRLLQQELSQFLPLLLVPLMMGPNIELLRLSLVLEALLHN